LDKKLYFCAINQFQKWQLTRKEVLNSKNKEEEKFVDEQEKYTARGI